jgi:hypothetical protein
MPRRIARSLFLIVLSAALDVVTAMLAHAFTPPSGCDMSSAY